MAVTFTVETGTQSSTANSYASVANGDDYHAKHLYSDAWDDADNSEKQEALMMATRLLDENVDWLGTKASDSQALQWPRYDVVDRGGYSIDSNEIPQELIDATCEFARLLLVQDRTAEPDTQGFKSMKAGSLAVEVDKFDRMQVIPPTVARMIPSFGVPRSIMTGRLVRA